MKSSYRESTTQGDKTFLLCRKGELIWRLEACELLEYPKPIPSGNCLFPATSSTNNHYSLRTRIKRRSHLLMKSFFLGSSSVSSVSSVSPERATDFLSSSAGEGEAASGGGAKVARDLASKSRMMTSLMASATHETVSIYREC